MEPLFGLSIILFVILGVLLSRTYQKRFIKSKSGYLPVIAWHTSSLFTHVVLLSVIAVIAPFTLVSVAIVISSVIVWLYVLGKTFVIGYHLSDGVWWKTYLIVIGTFCVEIPLYRLISTVWILSFTAR